MRVVEPSSDEVKKRSVALVRRRVLALPSELTRSLALPPPTPPSAQAARGRWVVTGVGASEGPARILVAALRETLGVVAELAPVSAFFEDPPRGEVLVVVSQRLCPNARLALAARGAFRETVLLTTLSASSDATVAALVAEACRVVTHGPTDEPLLLLRVLGPAVATVVALRLVIEVARVLGAPAPHWADAIAEVPRAAASAARQAEEAMRGFDASILLDRMVLVTTGRDRAHGEGLRLKVIEALGRHEPALWDVCGLVHGPLQSFFDDTATVVALERETPASMELVDRLARILRPPRHRLVRLRARLPGPLAAVEHDAALDALVVRALEAAPRDLVDWPAKGKDGPLYELGAEGVDLAPLLPAPCAAAHASRSAIVRFTTNAPGSESGSTQKYPSRSS